MKKTTLLGIGIVVLLVLNATTLGYVYFTSRQHPPHRPENREVIIRMLHFDEAQQRQYEQQIAWHRATINRLDQSIRQSKEELYALLGREGQAAKKDSLINQISGLQKQVEETHFKHFSDIRSICKPEQEQYYRQLVTELPKLFGPPPPKPER